LLIPEEIDKEALEDGDESQPEVKNIIKEMLVD